MGKLLLGPHKSLPFLTTSPLGRLDLLQNFISATSKSFCVVTSAVKEEDAEDLEMVFLALRRQPSYVSRTYPATEPTAFSFIQESFEMTREIASERLSGELNFNKSQEFMIC